MSFFDLPTELRFQIYGLIAIPVTAPFSDFSGLYLSCHQIKAELDDESPRVLAAYLARIASGTPGATVSVTSTGVRQHVRLTVNLSEFGSIRRTPDALASVLDLHFTTLTIGTAPRSLETYLHSADLNFLFLIRMFKSHSVMIKSSLITLDVPDTDLFTQEDVNETFRARGWEPAWSVSSVHGQKRRWRIVCSKTQI
jgi:hypothetical protein